ncbi:hypothetical protein C8J56DRAFT_553646 [Mycena floridula]|nr:hypothetical protein C8J56DRAFT_553646 [Mycena floridula]
MEGFDWDSMMQFASEHVETEKSSPVQQIPTPPLSDSGTPPTSNEPIEEESILVSVSTTFHPTAQLTQPGSQQSPPPDLALLSNDSVFFYVHSSRLLAASDNQFRSLLSNVGNSFVVSVPESSQVLNIILHAIYDLSCASYSPSFETLVAAVNRLPIYGVRPIDRILPKSGLYSSLLSHAPLFPLDVYALASCFDLYDLAVSTSPHLLSYQLSSLTDDQAQRIGPIYLKRLFFLHMGRSDALKRALLVPPHPHPPTSDCDFTEQRKVNRAWTMAAAYLAWEARPDLSTSMLDSTLIPLAEHIDCELCKKALRARIHDLSVQWSLVKRTI